MRAIVIFDSKFGNTEKIAQAIARGIGTLGSVRVLSAADPTPAFAERPDLLIVGGPTQSRGMSPALRSVLDAVPQGLRGVSAATFDTRYRGPKLIMGSAAEAAAKSLGKAGNRIVAAPEGFYVGRTGPMEQQALEGGELERAEAWARTVGAVVANGS
jgi:flavodoxin